MSTYGAGTYGTGAWAPPPPPLAVGPVRWTTPSLPIVVVLRVLVAVGLVLGMTTLASRTTERTTADLFAGLASGHVTSVTIERWDPSISGEGSLRVDWTQDGRRATATYAYSTLSASDHTDEGARIIAAATKANVPVTAVSGFSYPDGVVIPMGAWGLAATVAGLMLLVAGDQPRLATKWAWFWLISTIPALWIVFLVVEPLPLWARRPMPVTAHRRLTGGWAFLLAVVVLRPILQSVLGPGWDFLFGT